VSGRRRDLTTDEKKLWRRVAAGVKSKRALPADDDAAVEQRQPAKRGARSATVTQAPPPKAKLVSSPENRGNEKRVRRGKLEIGGSLDLHGHTQDTGRAALGRFLRASQRRGDRTVIVVTGVGRGGEGVLKRRLPEWLADGDIRPLVAGFAPAHRVHGGAGAFYVFLKRPDDNG
jgi:DNA-nicking Smr family endonuclease